MFLTKTPKARVSGVSVNLAVIYVNIVRGSDYPMTHSVVLVFKTAFLRALYNIVVFPVGKVLLSIKLNTFALKNAIP